MTKKKKTSKKQKSSAIEKIERSQKFSVSHLRLRALQLRDASSDLIKKIDRDGEKGYYSINHDCMRFAEDVWRTSLRLCELRELREILEKEG